MVAQTYKVLSIVLTVVVALIMAVPASHGRRFENPNLSVIARLKLGEESPSCWVTLVQLQACAGEVILFFLNGETYLGDACCHAIHVIGQQCWPNVFQTLGYTDEEGEILKGYCDHETAHDHPSFPSPPASFVQSVNGVPNKNLSP